MFISAILIVLKFLIGRSYFNRSWPAAFRDGRFLIAFTTSCIVNGSVDGSDWGCEGSISFGHGVSCVNSLSSLALHLLSKYSCNSLT